MGGNQSREEDQSVRIANQTEWPLCYIISQANPLYYGVIQPGDRITRQTGRVWFTVSTFPYTGTGEPSYAQVVAAELVPTVLDLLKIGLRKWGDDAGKLSAGIIEKFQVIVKPHLDGNMLPASFKEQDAKVVDIGGVKYTVKGEFATKLEGSLNRVSKSGHYANGDWLHVRGGPKAGVDWRSWEAMRFES